MFIGREMRGLKIFPLLRLVPRCGYSCPRTFFKSPAMTRLVEPLLRGHWWPRRWWFVLKQRSKHVDTTGCHRCPGCWWARRGGWPKSGCPRPRPKPTFAAVPSSIAQKERLRPREVRTIQARLANPSHPHGRCEKSRERSVPLGGSDVGEEMPRVPPRTRRSSIARRQRRPDSFPNACFRRQEPLGLQEVRGWSFCRTHWPLQWPMRPEVSTRPRSKSPLFHA